MTRKDFELIADVLSNYHTGEKAQKDTVEQIALTFAHRLQSTNPRFNIQRFVKACTKQFLTIIKK